jgi:hypothetical protein
VSASAAIASSKLQFVQAGTAAQPRTVQSKLRDVVSVKDFGAVGDGIHDDLAAIQAAIGDDIVDVYFPPGVYKVSDTIDVKRSSLFSSVGNQRNNAIIVTDGTLENKPVLRITNNSGSIKNLAFLGAPADRAKGVTAIRVEPQAYGTFLDQVYVFGFQVGVRITTFIVTLFECKIQFCLTNLSLGSESGPPALSETNHINIFGGVIANGFEYSAFLGDNRFAPPGTPPLFGFVINFWGCDLEGSPTRIADVGTVNFYGCYFEAPGSTVAEANGKHIYISPNNAPYPISVSVKGCFFRGGQYAVYCQGPPRGIYVTECKMSGVSRGGLYLPQDIYGGVYLNNDATGSFGQGTAFHTGIRGGVSAGVLNRFNPTDEGKSSVGAPPPVASGVIFYADNTGKVYVNNNPNWFRSYQNPVVNVNGVKSGRVITLDNLSDSYSFNGGDRISYGAVNTYIMAVNYELGTITTDDSVTSGAVSISQAQTLWREI